jgi:thiamine-phosphate pyrophosphorylase
VVAKIGERMTLPHLYPILDREVLARSGISLETAAGSLRQAGVCWLQYRDKQGSDAEVVAAMQRLRRVFAGGSATLLLNDRAHLCVAAAADGVHLGQQDMPPQEARRLLGPGAILGISTHNQAQLRDAVAAGAADYVAIGPVFRTGTKQNPDPVVGLAGVAAARALTTLPLVAIGGIQPEAARAVFDAGADAVAMISALMPSPRQRAALPLSAEQAMAERLRDILLLFR